MLEIIRKLHENKIPMSEVSPFADETKVVTGVDFLNKVLDLVDVVEYWYGPGWDDVTVIVP